MKKTQQAAAPEIVFGSAEPKVSVAISRQVKAGRLARIAPKLYTSNLKDPPVNSKNSVFHRKGAKNAKLFLNKNKRFSLRPLRLCGES